MKIAILTSNKGVEKAELESPYDAVEATGLVRSTTWRSSPGTCRP